MLTTFQWISFFAIILAALGGGLVPLCRTNSNGKSGEFPNGEAFAAGVFLALALTMMLPSAFHLFRVALPEFDYPLASVIAIVSFLILLSVEHYTFHVKTCQYCDDAPQPPLLPVIMTLMIAIPSFFLGAALGVSCTNAAVFIFIAIIAHKGTAGFALGLKLGKCSLSRKVAIIIFCCFVTYSNSSLGV